MTHARSQVTGHIAARILHEKLSSNLGKRLDQADYQVSKAQEREAVLGVMHIVPLQR